MWAIFEYLKKDCQRKTGKLYWHCSENDWMGPPQTEFPSRFLMKQTQGIYLHLVDALDLILMAVPGKSTIANQGTGVYSPTRGANVKNTPTRVA